MRAMGVWLASIGLGVGLSFGLGGCAQAPVAPAVELTDAAGYAARLPGRGAVASVNPLATRAGLDALARGGNAIDAAIATAFTLGVVDSHNSGIGGGCLILARLASGEILALDGREMAPGAATRDMFVRAGKAVPELSKIGPLAVGIPGSVAAYYALQQRAGALDFASVLLPAADIAAAGFPVDATLAQRLGGVWQTMQQFPATAAIFAGPDGGPLQAGERLVQKDLAASYRALAELGPSWFYQGPFAAATGAWMAANGGLITAADFAAYQAVTREPIAQTFAGHTVYGFPPPSSGGTVVAQILALAEAVDLRAAEPSARAHLLAESMRLAFADRAEYLGDGDFVAVPDFLLSPTYIAARAALVDRARAQPDASAGEVNLNQHTTHIAAADHAGNWVAITTTLNTSFGSKVVVPGTGVVLNNQMDDFAAAPGVPNAFGLVGGEANAVAPGKRPLSSMSPTLVMKNDQPVMTLGAAGGPTIISQVAQVLINSLLLDMPLQAAMATPRLHQQWRPGLTMVESALPDDIDNQLRARGHELKELGSFGGTQAIRFEDGELLPVTEPRVIERNQSAGP